MTDIPPPPPAGYEPPRPGDWASAPPATPQAHPGPADLSGGSTALVTPANGSSAGPLVAGVFAGPLVTLLALLLVCDGAQEMRERQMMMFETSYGRLAETCLGALLIAAVAVAGRRMPTAPLVAGVLLAAAGFAANASLGAFADLTDWWPFDSGRVGWATLLSDGSALVIGVVLTATGVARLVKR